MLSIKQRFLMDTYGYVIVPDLVDPGFMERIRKAMDRMDQELPTVPRSSVVEPGKPSKYEGTPHFSKFGPCIEYDPEFLDIAMHPPILSIAEEIVGGPVRYEEQECCINTREPDVKEIDVHKLGWHRGISPDFARYEAEGRAHYLWVKAIVFLTDIGPGDGGTSVIPGTHRSAPHAEIISEVEPWMTHQAQGKAGSVLFFTEALIHAVTPILSDRKRYIMITGYVAPFMREYSRSCQSSTAFMEKLTEAQRIFMTGDSKRAYYSFRL